MQQTVSSIDSPAYNSTVYCTKDRFYFPDKVCYNKQNSMVVSPPPTPVHSTTVVVAAAATTTNATTVGIDNNVSATFGSSDCRQFNKRTNTFVKTYANMVHTLKGQACHDTFMLNVYQEFKKDDNQKSAFVVYSNTCLEKKLNSRTSLRAASSSINKELSCSERSIKNVQKGSKSTATFPQKKHSKLCCAQHSDLAICTTDIENDKSRKRTAIMTETGNNSIAEFGVLQKKKISHQPLQKLSAAITRPSKRKRVTISSILPIGKEAQAAFDALDIDSTDEVYYPEGWIPSNHALDEHNGAIKFSWKGSPMNIEGQAYYDHLHPAEIMMASSLRLSPVQYLKCKRTLIMAAKKLQEQRVPFTKSVAQRLCRVDVNKTSALWTIFGQLGWFN